MKKLGKIIGIVTIPPVIGAITLIILHITGGSGFSDATGFWLGLFCISIFPVLAYAIHALVPALKKGGRDSQRKTAFVMAPIGYLLGLVLAFVFKLSSSYMALFLGYVFSGGILCVLNACKVKASGHACGVTGPVLISVYFLGSFSWLWMLLLPVIYWARMATGRHTFKELFLGSFSAFLGVALAILLSAYLWG